MPEPGVTFMLASIWACCVWPAALSAATACSWVSPAGICWLTTPLKMMSVALPRIFGPTTANVTLTIANATTRRILGSSGLRVLTRRRNVPLKFLGFSGGSPTPPNGPPPGRGGGRRPAAPAIMPPPPR